MTTEQILISIIVGLVGLLAGGAGGATLFRRVMGTQADSPTANAAVVANAAAISASSAATTALSNHLGSVEATLIEQGKTLNRIELEQAHLSEVFKQFPITCTLRHKQVEENHTRMQTEIDGLRKCVT